MTQRDQWSKWLLETRFGGDAEAAARAMRRLHAVRDEVLKSAALNGDETILDVGCGDGLIAFGAIERLSSAGHVIFSDVSQPLLDHCERLATEAGLLDRCSFTQASAGDLASIADVSVDVVTTRSVLIYVKDKGAAFRAFYRVLRPGGRVSLFEPINRFNDTYAPDEWWGTGIGPVKDLARRLRDFYRKLQPPDSDPMLDFDQHDLLRACEAAGFRSVHLAYHVLVEPAPPADWDGMINSPGNPNIPSMAEAMRRIFTDDERARFEACLRPLVERGGRTTRSAVAYLSARKGDSEEPLDA